MKAKHRIIKEFGLYYPQWKGWFFWHFFLERFGPSKIYFSTLEKAKEYIEESKSKIVWEENE